MKKYFLGLITGLALMAIAAVTVEITVPDASVSRIMAAFNGLSGRGISTNLLFSAFESWMTTQHRQLGFPESWLQRTYAETSIGNGTMAILAGIVAQLLEDKFGHIGPFQGLWLSLSWRSFSFLAGRKIMEMPIPMIPVIMITVTAVAVAQMAMAMARRLYITNLRKGGRPPLKIPKFGELVLPRH